MIKIAIVGAPSTGKTVVARRLANTLGMLGYQADHVLEYARTYLFRYIKPVIGKRQDLLDQVMIYHGQKRREEDLKHCDFVICDSATFIPFIFAGHNGYELDDPREVMVVHKLYKWSLSDVTGYNFIFYLPPNIEYKPEDARWKVSTVDERGDIARRIENYLLDIKYPFHRVEGETPVDREKTMLDILLLSNNELKEKLDRLSRG